MSREQKAVARARKAFETGRSKPLEHRIHQLKNLQRLLTERKKEIVDAIKKDLGKVSSTRVNIEEQIYWWTRLSLQYLSFANCKMANNFFFFLKKKQPY